MATSKPISILLIGMEPTEELVALREKGHEVLPLLLWVLNKEKPIDAFDAIVGPKCWRYLPDISDKWLPLLLKEARAAQPPRVKKAKVKKGGTATG